MIATARPRRRRRCARHARCTTRAGRSRRHRRCARARRASRTKCDVMTTPASSQPRSSWSSASQPRSSASPTRRERAAHATRIGASAGATSSHTERCCSKRMWQMRLFQNTLRCTTSTSNGPSRGDDRKTTCKSHASSWKLSNGRRRRRRDREIAHAANATGTRTGATSTAATQTATTPHAPPTPSSARRTRSAIRPAIQGRCPSRLKRAHSSSFYTTNVGH
jgi:hypothetical protein